MKKYDLIYERKKKIYYNNKNDDLPLINAVINIDQNRSGVLKIYSFSNIEDEINNFCYKYNLFPKAKLYIKKAIIQGINTKINECKLLLI